MNLSSRHVFITPYHKEEREVIERCIRSVQAQEVAADHILIADGCPQAWIDAQPVQHIVLNRPHHDFGNTPRGVGALLAISESYEGIGFLDADNWLEANHLSSCLRAAAGVRDCDFVIARRNWRRPDGTILNAPDEPVAQHVDTNCFYLLAGSLHLLPQFAMIPRMLAAQGDRIFYAALRSAGLNSALVPDKTVNYHCLWASVYTAAGECPPDNAKNNLDAAPALRWLMQQSARGLEIAGRRSGVRFGRQGIA